MDYFSVYHELHKLDHGTAGGRFGEGFTAQVPTAKPAWSGHNPSFPNMSSPLKGVEGIVELALHNQKSHCGVAQTSFSVSVELHQDFAHYILPLLLKMPDKLFNCGVFTGIGSGGMEKRHLVVQSNLFSMAMLL